VIQGLLSGSVWFDGGSPSGAGSADRQRGPDELGVADWTAEVVYPPGHPKAGQIATLVGGQPATAVTDANGQYQIAGLPPGDYQVRFRSPAGAIYGTPANGEQGTAQLGSSVNPIARTLSITMPAGAGLAQQGLPVDPSGVLYNSVTRQPVIGATVSLIGPNGQPVPADQLLPGQQNQTVVASGPAAGSYRFDLLPTAPAGTYTLQVTPPPGYEASKLIPPQPSPVTPGLYPLCAGIAAGFSCPVQPQAGPPQAGVHPSTAYYSSFNLTPGGTPDVVHNHIALDPAAPAQLFIEKLADRRVVEVGDSMSYSIRVRNPNAYAVPAALVIDKLPLGFKAIAGTSTLMVAGPLVLSTATPVVVADPAGLPGPTLTYLLGTLQANTDYTIRYRVRVGVGADKGSGINTAQASAAGGTVRSLEARAAVQVTGGVFSTEACLIGKVYVDCNQNKVQDRGEPGIPGVRLYMEDGSNFTTDENGQYSVCGLRPISHVIKVDPTTLPVGARLGVTSSRNLGDAEMLVLDAKNGELHRADFREMSCFPKVLEQVQQRRRLGPVLVPEKQTGKDDPWGIEFNSEQHRLDRTPAAGRAVIGRPINSKPQDANPTQGAAQ
jgi:large repetitive protein